MLQRVDCLAGRRRAAPSAPMQQRVPVTGPPPPPRALGIPAVITDTRDRTRRTHAMFQSNGGDLHPLLATCPSRKGEASMDMGAEGPGSPRDVDQVGAGLPPGADRRPAPALAAPRRGFPRPIPQPDLHPAAGGASHLWWAARLGSAAAPAPLQAVGGINLRVRSRFPASPSCLSPAAGRPMIDTQGPAGSRVPDLDDRPLRWGCRAAAGQRGGAWGVDGSHPAHTHVARRRRRAARPRPASIHHAASNPAWSPLPSSPACPQPRQVWR